jgi:threonine/homoserine/homoserine lactone efflux protein
MLELNFLAFCLTIVVVTAIVFGKTDVAIKALSTLNGTTKGFLTVLGKIVSQLPVPETKNQKKPID